MRSRQLRAALQEFAVQAGGVLASATADGAEVGFEVVEQRLQRGGPSLYCYRPLTGEFISRHAPELQQLETYLPALHALAATEDLLPYLQGCGVAHPPGGQRERAEIALRLLVERAFDGSESDFELDPARFESAFVAFCRAAVEGRSQSVAVALMRGLAISSPEVALADGVTLMQADAFDALPPDSGWDTLIAGGPLPATLIVISFGTGEVDASAAELTRARIATLLTAVRLFAAGIAVEPLAWMRTDDSAWWPLMLDVRGRARAAAVVVAEQEDELRAFCSLVARRAPRGGELGWALKRFELGCEHADSLEALTDYLLALRALLEPEGQRSGRLSGRLAALCALPPDRVALAERVAHAISLEQNAIAGLAPHDRDVEGLVEGMAQHLRALLRDVLCGHLDSDLVGVADDLIDAGFEEAGEVNDAADPDQWAPVVADSRQDVGEDDDEVTGTIAAPPQALSPMPAPEAPAFDDLVTS